MCELKGAMLPSEACPQQNILVVRIALAPLRRGLLFVQVRLVMTAAAGLCPPRRPCAIRAEPLRGAGHTGLRPEPGPLPLLCA